MNVLPWILSVLLAPYSKLLQTILLNKFQR